MYRDIEFREASPSCSSGVLSPQQVPLQLLRQEGPVDRRHPGSKPTQRSQEEEVQVRVGPADPADRLRLHLPE